MRERTEYATQLMFDFAERTGLTSERHKQRYLWTDAFAVCNWLGLARATSGQRYTDLALACVEQVHYVLGRHRGDDPRRGWISGLDEQTGRAHPTRGGLRIGKPLPERGSRAPFDEQLEWDRDGQYFHYLTRWMHALDQAARATRQPRFNLWARELAETAHRAFTYAVPRMAGRRMVWKMSIDLSRPLVSSMGQHDPLDGLVTCAQLRATASILDSGPDGPSLERETADFATIAEGQDWATSDALGLGGLLADACRIAWLMRHGLFADAHLLDAVLAAATRGLADYARQADLYVPPGHRLAFRELGLAIGLHGVALLERELPALQRFTGAARLESRLRELEPYAALAAVIEAFWLASEHRRTQSWLEHRDINDVMLATCLLPESYLLVGAGDLAPAPAVDP